MKNLSKKHLKQIYRRKMSDKRFVLIPAAFFRAASNNMKDHDRMMAWRQSMRTNVRYMFIGEQIKRRKKK
jgi:hypothetical protein